MKAANISIIGGGIGGLAAAAALLKKGFKVQVYERARALRPIGAGLTLSPNGLNSLEAVQPGIIQALKNAGSEVNSTTMKRSSGETFISRPITVAQQFGQPLLNIQWSRLQSILASFLPPGIINLNHRCIGIEQHESGVKAIFENGRIAESDLLIGADGINSAIRQAVIGDGAPVYAGRMSWLATIPFSHEELPLHAITGYAATDGRNLLLFDVGDGYTFWSAGALSAEPTASGGANDVKERVLKTYSGWAEPVETILKATPAADIVERPISDRPPVRHWSKGRVTLLGDAAHLVVPALGQGANMTFEDAYELAEFLSSSDDVGSAFHAYEASRSPRTEMIFHRSAAEGLSYFKPDSEASLARTVERMSQDEFLTWLFSYRPTPVSASAA